MLASMVKEFGGIPKILPVASDNELDIYNILNSSTDCDLIITTGGVSVGKYDLIQKALKNFERNKKVLNTKQFKYIIKVITMPIQANH